jgi:hypothetical protein
LLLLLIPIVVCGVAGVCPVISHTNFPGDCKSLLFAIRRVNSVHPDATVAQPGKGGRERAQPCPFARCMAPAPSITTVLCFQTVFSMTPQLRRSGSATNPCNFGMAQASEAVNRAFPEAQGGVTDLCTQSGEEFAGPS